MHNTSLQKEGDYPIPRTSEFENCNPLNLRIELQSVRLDLKSIRGCSMFIYYVITDGGRGVCRIYYNITWGGGGPIYYNITWGGGFSETPKLYYVIYEQPLRVIN